MRLAVRLSARRWEVVMKELFMQWDDTRKGHVPLHFNGVSAPRPPGRRKFDKFIRIFREQYGIQRIGAEGEAAALDLV